MLKRNVFITFDQADDVEVATFLDSFADVFNQVKVLGVSDEDVFDTNTFGTNTLDINTFDTDTFGTNTLDINTFDTNTDAVLQTIGERYLTGTSVTIVLIGNCTWSRRYVDWEIAATLRNNEHNPPGGLLAIQLPAVSGRSDIKVPQRLGKNLSPRDASGYASYRIYPRRASSLAEWVEDAISHRDTLEPVAGSISDLQREDESC